MKRYVVVMVVLVAVDQLLGWAANTAFANGQELVIRIGRWDHAALIAHFSPLLGGHIIAMLMLAVLFRVGLGGQFYKLFGLPVALVTAALVTQVIDMLARGYAVNYVGIGGEGWVVKITDTATEIAWLYTAALVAVGLFRGSHTKDESIEQ